MDDSVVLSSAPANAPSPPVKRSNACRCLFGRPDPRVVDEWLKEQLDQIRYEQQLKWGFGFDPENPCATSSNDYVFTAVPADSVPQFYRTTYYPKTSRSRACDVENCAPSGSSKSTSAATAACTNPESPVLPSASATTATAVASSKRGRRKMAKNQTKLTAFMKVDSRKRLRQQAKAANMDSFSSSCSSSSSSSKASASSPAKSMRLTGQQRSSV